MSRADIDQLLVSELRVLEELRRSYVARHPAAGLEREDPDVQRIIEALALFSVRSRLSQQRNLQSTWRRLFASYFDFLLAPLPSCAVLQAVVTPRLVETVTIERGTLLRLTTTSGKTATFTTLADLRATRQRHFEVIAVFVERLRQLAAADVHVHLTSDDINPGLVHQRIYPDPPAKS